MEQLKHKYPLVDEQISLVIEFNDKMCINN